MYLSQKANNYDESYKSSTTVYYGDLNRDGDVDAFDLTLLARYTSKIITKFPVQE